MAQVQIMFVATANGLIQLANPGKSDRWRTVGETFAGENIIAVAASPVDPLSVFAATSSAVMQTQDGGSDWNVVYTGAVTTLAVTSQSVFIGTASGTLIEPTSGGGWQDCVHGPSPVLTVSPLLDDLAVVFGDGTVQRGRPGQWHALPALQGAASTIAISARSPERIWATNSRTLFTPTGPTPIPVVSSGALALLQGNTETLVLGTHGPLLRSDDDGVSLTPVAGPEHVAVLTPVDHFIDWLYAGTVNGELWFSKDRAKSWTQLAAALAPIRALSFARLM
ncbi:MAG: hypothetical protein NVS4B8_09730 [Herpetosiphon sp.]